MKTRRYYFSSLQGERPSNEDYEKIFINLDQHGNTINPDRAPINLFIICDGHGGDIVSKYSSAKLEKILSGGKMSYPLEKPTIQNIYSHIQNSLIKNQMANLAGSTALVLIYFYQRGQPTIQVINLGDCRAVLYADGLPHQLTIDHNLLAPVEIERIAKVNQQPGVTKREIKFTDMVYRIGSLSVSRSFGDEDETPHVTHLPDSMVYKLDTDDEFIIMGCDGVWESLDNNSACNFVKNCLGGHGIMYHNIASKTHKYTGNKLGFSTEEVIKSTNVAEKLAHYAIAEGSTDNVSVIIIMLK